MRKCTTFNGKGGILGELQEKGTWELSKGVLIGVNAFMGQRKPEFIVVVVVHCTVIDIMLKFLSI